MLCKPKAPAQDPAAEKQLSQSIETFRFLFDLMVKVWTFMVAANGVVFGFGVVTKAFGPILLGALISFVAAVLPPMLSRSTIPLAYSAFAAERKLQKGSFGLVQIFGWTVFNRLTAEFARIQAGPEDRVSDELRRLSKGPRFMGRSLTALLLVTFLAQVAIAIYFANQGAPFFDVQTAVNPSPSVPAVAPLSPSPQVSAVVP